jgi:simple sugar transport system permease protein
VALLMIGGEFDLSAGVAVTASALVAAMLSYELSANMWVGVVVALVAALVIGFINGYLVVKTGIPSFLVTLGTFFMLRGLNLAVTKIVTGNVATNAVDDIQGFELGRKVFASTFNIGGVGIRITLLWWILFVAIATWVLLRTHVGNWIFAVGGSAASARAVGVPVNKVKIGLFMTVGFMAWFTGMHILFDFNTVQSGVGLGNEFIYIVAAVVGGCLLTGGYGSVIGAAIGAFIFGMTNQGIIYAGWNPDWFYFFLGALLLGAILLNNFIRSRAEASR